MSLRYCPRETIISPSSGEAPSVGDTIPGVHFIPGTPAAGESTAASSRGQHSGEQGTAGTAKRQPKAARRGG